MVNSRIPEEFLRHPERVSDADYKRIGLSFMQQVSIELTESMQAMSRHALEMRIFELVKIAMIVGLILMIYYR